MNGAVFLIMLTVGLGLAATGAMLYIDNAKQLAEKPIEEVSQAQPRLVSVQAYNTTNNSARYVRIQVASDQPVRVNDTRIQLVTSDTAHLRYRDGALERNETGGFYTK